MVTRRAGEYGIRVWKRVKMVGFRMGLKQSDLGKLSSHEKSSRNRKVDHLLKDRPYFIQSGENVFVDYIKCLIKKWNIWESFTNWKTMLCLILRAYVWIICSTCTAGFGRPLTVGSIQMLTDIFGTGLVLSGFLPSLEMYVEKKWFIKERSSWIQEIQRVIRDAWVWTRSWYGKSSCSTGWRKWEKDRI